MAIRICPLTGSPYRPSKLCTLIWTTTQCCRLNHHWRNHWMKSSTNQDSSTLVVSTQDSVFGVSCRYHFQHFLQSETRLVADWDWFPHHHQGTVRGLVQVQYSTTTSSSWAGLVLLECLVWSERGLGRHKMARLAMPSIVIAINCDNLIAIKIVIGKWNLIDCIWFAI